MGGALILVTTLVSTLLWAESAQPPRVDRARRHLRLRPHRLLRRLPEARGAQLHADWRRAGSTSGSRCAGLATAATALLHRAREPARDRRCSCRSSRPSPSRSAAVGFIALAYLMIVGMSNAVNLTDGLDGLAIMPAALVSARARHLRLRQRQRRVRPLPGDPGDPRRRRAADLLRARSPARASASCGSTPIRRRCSWATSARWRSAPRSASSR